MNILVVSDIHIHDYTNRSPQEKFRLDQSKIVAQNIINAGKTNNCEVIVFAGDILEKSLIRSYIQATAKDFLQTVMSGFNYGFIIYGNHDIDHKDQTQIMTDSCLGFILPPNLYYADQQVAKLGSSLCAFSNWKPNFDLSWINSKVDVLFTHATINYGVGVPVKSQYLDETKFDLAICGDIHLPASMRKYVSIGVPQKCKMGDSDYCTGVVYNTETKTWNHVDLNPQDNLLKFQYTNDMTIEGYSKLDNTWYIYQPTNIGIKAGVNNIQIPAWQETQDLIDQLIIQNGLSSIHQEILGKCVNIDFDDVDFNYIPIRFACKNWRSIDDIEIFFNQGDKFLVRGLNGSGKSSLFSAIKYALYSDNPSSLKSFTTFGQKDCQTEIEFLYQGKTYIIRKSSDTKNCGLWVDGVQVKYASKKDLDQDIQKRFPFTTKKYLKFFFFDDTNLQLINSLSEEELINIVSKFFKFNKIDTYHKIASDALLKIKESGKQFFERKVLLEKQLSDVNQKLSTINVPSGKTLSELQTEMKEYHNLQKKFNIYTDYLEKGKEVSGRIEMLQLQLIRAKEKLSEYSALGTLVAQINEYQSRLIDLQGLEDKYNQFNLMVNSCQKELDKCLEEGKKLQEKFDSLNPDKCPICGQTMDREHFEAHQSELKLELSKKTAEYFNLKSTLENLKKERGSYKSNQKEIQDLQSEINSLISEKSEVENLQFTIKSAETEIEKCKDKIGTSEIPEKVSLPDNIVEIISDLQNSINAIEVYNSLLQDKTTFENDLKSVQAQIDAKSKLCEHLGQYVNLTSPIGDIYAEIFKKLSKDFSDTQVRYEIKKFTKNTKEHLCLVPQFNVQGNWCPYEACSSGQRTFLDIHFMSKINTGTGFLTMDEFLKSLDPENHDICLDMLSQIPASCMLISSHMETVANFNNRQINVSMTKSGSSQLIIT